MGIFAAIECEYCKVIQRLSGDERPAKWVQLIWKEETQEDFHVDFCSHGCASAWLDDYTRGVVDLNGKKGK